MDAGLSNMIMIGMVLVVAYFFMIRPQQKRAKELKNFRNSMAKGTKVVSTGGIHGKVIEVRDNNTVLVDTQAGSKLIFERESLTPEFDPVQKK